MRRRYIIFPEAVRDDVGAMMSWASEQQKYVTISLKKKRNRIKFNKNKQRYIKRWVKWQIIGSALTKPIRQRLNYAGISSKFIICEKWPDAEPLVFDRSEE